MEGPRVQMGLLWNHPRIRRIRRMLRKERMRLRIVMLQFRLWIRHLRHNHVGREQVVLVVKGVETAEEVSVVGVVVEVVVEEDGEEVVEATVLVQEEEEEGGPIPSQIQVMQAMQVQAMANQKMDGIKPLNLPGETPTRGKEVVLLLV